MPTSLAALQDFHAFNSVVSTFSKTIRTDVISIKHAGVILAHYDRFGQLYDQCCRILINEMRDRALYGEEATTVATVVIEALKEARTVRES